MNFDFWQDKKVFLTGHTGFKGGWLAFWLTHLGAKVYGFSLDAPREHSFAEKCRVEHIVTDHKQGDIRDAQLLEEALRLSGAEIVFHLAAQPIVRASYENPLETYQTNVMGTLNVLEAIKKTGSVRSAVIITTDKCYENKEIHYGYKEEDPLGGYDMYSSSKACAEILTSSYRRSFLNDSGAHVATARAGNVIGGGDMAPDRLLPDIFRSMLYSQKLIIRNPKSVRPWQHVLDLLCGYMDLAQRLYEPSGENYVGAWNFGPKLEDVYTVGQILNLAKEFCPQISWDIDDKEHVHEATLLSLDSDKAVRKLGWEQRLGISDSVRLAIEWFNKYREGDDMERVSLMQIKDFCEQIP